MIAAAVVRIVDDKHIPGVDILRMILTDHTSGRKQQRRQKHRNAGFDLNHHIAGGIHDCRRVIPPFFDIGGIRGLDDNRVRLFSNRHQQVADHFYGYGISLSLMHFPSPPHHRSL